jgi:hypothetical protein
VLTIDQPAAARALQGAQDRLVAGVATHDPAGAPVDALMPLALPLGA